MPSLFLGSKFSTTNFLGYPLAGGRVYTYTAGDAMTPLVTYSDAAGTIPNTNPVLLDATGRASIRLQSGVAYRIRITDASGILAPDGDVDNITAIDASSIDDAINGSDLRLFNPSGTYESGTIGAAIQNRAQNVMDLLTTAERSQVLSGGTVADLTPRINAAKSLNRPLYLPAQKWSITGVDLKGYYGGLVGDGVISTTLQARTAGVMIDANDSTDTALGPYVLKSMTLAGVTTATYGIYSRYRHNTTLADLYIINCTTAGIREKDTFLSRDYNVRIQSCTIGRWMEGSDHASASFGMCITGASGTGLLLQSNGTAADGNDALGFFGMNISDCDGFGVDDGATSSAFYGCYLGENVNKTVFTNRVGTAVISGGVMFVGATAASYGFSPLGGLIKVAGMRINGQTYGSLSMLTTGSGGKVTFEDCQFNVTTGGNQVLDGDPIGYGRRYECFAPTNPRAYSTTAINCTTGYADATNKRTFTVSALGAGTPTMLITAPLSSALWIEGLAYLVVTYASNIEMVLRLSGGVGGGAPTRVLAVLPTTAGVTKTAVKLDATLDVGAYTTIEIFSSSVVVGSYLALTSLHLSDSRMPIGNLWKC